MCGGCGCTGSGPAVERSSGGRQGSAFPNRTLEEHCNGCNYLDLVPRRGAQPFVPCALHVWVRLPPHAHPLQRNAVMKVMVLWSSGVLATLSRWRSRVRTPSGPRQSEWLLMVRWCSWLSRHPLKVETTGSNPVRTTPRRRSSPATSQPAEMSAHEMESPVRTQRVSSVVSVRGTEGRKPCPAQPEVCPTQGVSAPRVVLQNPCKHCGFSCFNIHGGRSSAGRAPGCDPGRRGFESRRSPHVLVAQWIERQLAELEVAGSSPAENATGAQAFVAQWIERQPPELDVTGSSPVEGAAGVAPAKIVRSERHVALPGTGA